MRMLVWLVVGVMAALTPGCGRAPGPAAGQNVVLITVDTLRADRVGAYGHSGARTPNMDRLAEEGVLFEQAISPVPVTLPSHASLLTGLFPPTHGVRDNTYFKLDEDASTLAEILKAEGYNTAAFIGAFVLDERFGLAQGFDLYDDDVGDAADNVDTVDTGSDTPGRFAERKASDVVRSFAAWLASESTREPFFAWLHFFDPHLPYAAPPPFGNEFRNSPYDGEIAYTDEQIGAVVRQLSESGLLDDTLIVLTSDHGESLGEHGEKSHGFFVYDQTLRVPLILKSKRSLAAGQRVSHQVRLVDVLPTVLDLLALPIPDTVQGESLVPALDSETGYAAYAAYAECYAPQLNFRWAPLVTLRRDGYKYIDAPTPELYDLSRDPAETRNLYESEPRRARAMRDELSALLESWPESFSSRQQPDPETIERLRSLGYAGSGGGNVARGLPGLPGLDDARDLPDPPDPKDRLHLWSRLEELVLHQSARDFDAVTRGAQSVLDEDDTNLLALELLAKAHSESGRPEEALAVYDRLLKLDDTRPLRHVLHGNLLWSMDRTDDAESSFLAALEKDPEMAGAHRRLGELYLSTGRAERARKHFESALAIEDTADTRLGLARSLRATGDASGALAELERLSRSHPGEPSFVTEYAATLAQQGEVEKAIRILLEGPDHIDVHYTLSVIHRANGRMVEARAALERAVELAPNFASAQNDLGVILSRAGELDRAITAFTIALSVQDTPITRNALGTALCRLDRCDEGIPHFEKAVGDAPEFWEALENLAQAYDVVGRAADAERTERRADELKAKR